MKFFNIPTLEQWKTASSSFFQSASARPNKPTLVRIDDLVKKYHQVFDVAKLNILMELKDAIVAWEDDKIDRDVGTGRLGAMKALMEVVLRKLSELDGWGQHQYLKVCCIGYPTETGTYKDTILQGAISPDARRVEESVEIGIRVAKLRNAIIDAHSSYILYKATKKIPDDEDSKILKIFMAPEFYFRGPYGAYQDIAQNANIMSKMREETSKPIYKDWLFVLGTALFSTDKEKQQGNNMVKVGNLLENFALVQKGGPKTHEHQDLIVAKEFPSHVDFAHPHLSTKAWFDPNKSEAIVGGQIEKHIAPPGARTDPYHRGHDDLTLDPNTASVSELVGGTIFTIDGITFGLEVCRDHLIGRLSHSKESGKVLIQLIPSCGASIETKFIACVPGGIVFNVDGDAPGQTDAKVNGASTGNSPIRTMAVNPYSPRGKKIEIYDPETIPWPKRTVVKSGALRRAAEPHMAPSGP